MSRLLSTSLAEALDRASNSDSRLVLLVGESPQALYAAASGAAGELGWPVVDLNTALSQRLVGLLPAERRDEAWDALEEVVGVPSPGVVLSGTDVLFDPALGYRPYEALRRQGRRGPIVATWLGRVEGSDIVRSEPGHPEYTRVRLDVPFIAVPSPGESS